MIWRTSKKRKRKRKLAYQSPKVVAISINQWQSQEIYLHSVRFHMPSRMISVFLSPNGSFIYSTGYTGPLMIFEPIYFSSIAPLFLGIHTVSKSWKGFHMSGDDLALTFKLNGNIEQNRKIRYHEIMKYEIMINLLWNIVAYASHHASRYCVHIFLILIWIPATNLGDCGQFLCWRLTFRWGAGLFVWSQMSWSFSVSP